MRAGESLPPPQVSPYPPPQVSPYHPPRQSASSNPFYGFILNVSFASPISELSIQGHLSFSMGVSTPFIWEFLWEFLP